MDIPRSPSRNGSSLRALAASIVLHRSGLFFLGGALLLNLLVLDPFLWAGGDDATNLMAIRNHLAGYGYRVVPDPAAAEYTTDRTYLLLLTMIISRCGENYYLLKMVTAAASAVTVWLLFLIARQHQLPPRQTLWATTLLLTSPPALLYLNILIPEMMFLAVSMVFCYAGQQYLSGGRWFDGWLPVVAISGLILKNLGNSSLIFFLAFFLATALHGRRRFTFMFLPPAVVLFALRGPEFIRLNLVYYAREGFPLQPILYKVAAYACKYLPAQIVPDFTNLSYRLMANRPLLFAGYALGLLLTAIITAGLVRLAATRRSLAAVIVGVTLLVLVNWHVIEGGRFLFIILPYLLLGLVVGLPARYPRTGVVLLTALLLANCLALFPSVWRVHAGAGDPAYRSYDQAIRWLAARDTRCTIGVRKNHPALASFFTVRITDYQTPREVAANTRQVKYLVSDAFREWDQSAFRKMVEWSGAYREIYRTVAPVVVVYQRAPEFDADTGAAVAAP